MSEHDPSDTDAPKAKGNQTLRRQIEANDIKWLMSSKQGRRIVWRLLGEAGVFRSSFTGNSETFFREGKRQMGLFILAEVSEHSPESYAEMQREAKAQNA